MPVQPSLASADLSVRGDSVLLVLEPVCAGLTDAPWLLGGDESSIGSEADCTWTLQVAGIAPRHCVIVREGNRYRVKAVDYRLWLNNRPIRDGYLRVGDRLTLGPLDFRVRAASPVELLATVPNVSDFAPEAAPSRSEVGRRRAEVTPRSLRQTVRSIHAGSESDPAEVPPEIENLYSTVAEKLARPGSGVSRRPHSSNSQTADDQSADDQSADNLHDISEPFDEAFDLEDDGTVSLSEARAARRMATFSAEEAAAVLERLFEARQAQLVERERELSRREGELAAESTRLQDRDRELRERQALVEKEQQRLEFERQEAVAQANRSVSLVESLSQLSGVQQELVSRLQSPAEPPERDNAHVLEELAALKTELADWASQSVARFDTLGNNLDTVGGHLAKFGGQFDKLEGDLDKLGGDLDRIGKEPAPVPPELAAFARQLQDREEALRAETARLAELSDALRQQRLEQEQAFSQQIATCEAAVNALAQAQNTAASPSQNGNERLTQRVDDEPRTSESPADDTLRDTDTDGEAIGRAASAVTPTAGVPSAIVFDELRKQIEAALLLNAETMNGLLQREEKLQTRTEELARQAEGLAAQQQRLAARDAELSEAQAEWKRKEAETAAAQARLDALRDSLSSQERENADLRALIDSQVGELERRQEAIGAQEQHLRVRSDEIRRDTDLLEQHRQALETEKQAVERERSELSHRERQLSTRATSLTEHERALQSFEHKLDQRDRGLLEREEQFTQHLRDLDQEAHLLERLTDDLELRERRQREAAESTSALSASATSSVAAPFGLVGNHAPAGEPGDSEAATLAPVTEETANAADADSLALRDRAAQLDRDEAELQQKRIACQHRESLLAIREATLTQDLESLHDGQQQLDELRREYDAQRQALREQHESLQRRELDWSESERLFESRKLDLEQRQQKLEEQESLLCEQLAATTALKDELTQDREALQTERAEVASLQQTVNADRERLDADRTAVTEQQSALATERQELDRERDALGEWRGELEKDDSDLRGQRINLAADQERLEDERRLVEAAAQAQKNGQTDDSESRHVATWDEFGVVPIAESAPSATQPVAEPAEPPVSVSNELVGAVDQLDGEPGPLTSEASSLTDDAALAGEISLDELDESRVTSADDLDDVGDAAPSVASDDTMLVSEAANVTDAATSGDAECSPTAESTADEIATPVLSADAFSPTPDAEVATASDELSMTSPSLAASPTDDNTSISLVGHTTDAVTEPDLNVELPPTAVAETALSPDDMFGDIALDTSHTTEAATEPDTNAELPSATVAATALSPDDMFGDIALDTSHTTEAVTEPDTNAELPSAAVGAAALSPDDMFGDIALDEAAGSLEQPAVPVGLDPVAPLDESDIDCNSATDHLPPATSAASQGDPSVDFAEVAETAHVDDSLAAIERSRLDETTLLRGPLVEDAIETTVASACMPTPSVSEVETLAESCNNPLADVATTSELEPAPGVNAADADPVDPFIDDDGVLDPKALAKTILRNLSTSTRRERPKYEAAPSVEAAAVEPADVSSVTDTIRDDTLGIGSPSPDTIDAEGTLAPSATDGAVAEDAAEDEADEEPMSWAEVRAAARAAVSKSHPVFALSAAPAIDETPETDEHSNSLSQDGASPTAAEQGTADAEPGASLSNATLDASNLPTAAEPSSMDDEASVTEGAATEVPVDGSTDATDATDAVDQKESDDEDTEEQKAVRARLAAMFGLSDTELNTRAHDHHRQSHAHGDESDSATGLVNDDEVDAAVELDGESDVSEASDLRDGIGLDGVLSGGSGALLSEAALNKPAGSDSWRVRLLNEAGLVNDPAAATPGVGAEERSADNQNVSIDEVSDEEQRKLAPVPDPVAESSAEAEESDATAENEEDSISSYMERLLARSRRGSEAPKSHEPAPAYKSRSSAPVSKPVEKAPEEPVPDVSDENQPVRVRAPVDQDAIRQGVSSLRAVANLSARSNLAQSTWKKHRDTVYAKFAMAGVGFAIGGGIGLFGIAARPNLIYPAIASGVLGIVMLVSALRTLLVVRSIALSAPAPTEEKASPASDRTAATPIAAATAPAAEPSETTA